MAGTDCTRHPIGVRFRATAGALSGIIYRFYVRKKHVFMKRILVFVLGFTAVACGHLPNLSPHRIEIQQGNFISQEMVAQLKSGMTKDQVRFAMGTPLVADVFHGDRWDYVFIRRRADSSDTERRRISVYFEQDRLIRIEGDVVAAGSNASMPSAAGTRAESDQGGSSQ